MRWSYRIFKVKGISVELHLTFLLFFMFILLSMGVQAFMFFFLIFTIVLAHEMIHSFTAILYGINVPKITLLPIGGLASIELPADPMLELKVSVVGPLFNFMLAGVGFIMLTALQSGFIGYNNVMEGVLSGTFGMDNISSVLNVIIYINLILGAFNMLPAFPMDGGRVFRSVLALWMDYAVATRIATIVGQLIFVALMLLGLVINHWWVFIGFFLFYASGSEMKYVNLKRAMEGVRLHSIAVTGLNYVNAELPWRDFISTVYRKGRNIYLMVDAAGMLKGVLDLHEVKSVNPEMPIGEVEGVDYTVLDGDLKVEDVLKLLLVKRLVLVTQQGRFVGYVTPETLSDSATYLQIARRVDAAR
jgi:Zn-dependent protease